MNLPTSVRRLVAAGAVALYALVALLLLPMHLLEGPPGSGGDRGPALVADCHERNCHQPSHHHGEGGHSHDPATCVKCSQAAASGTAVAIDAIDIPVPAFARPAAPDAAPAAVSLLRAVPAARGPPALS